jgi:peptidoglycan/LPS O-acetylase OafA/YrhL
LAMEKRKFFPHINALRFVAILSTVLGHWFLVGGITDRSLLWGEYGVDLFFTISGFLITLNLLESKEQFPIKTTTKIKNFFVNRSLRIFPAYFSLLIILTIIQHVGNITVYLKGSGIYFFTYSSNFLFYFKGLPPVSYLNHTWSLAVEEQFYIIWPFVIFFLPLERILYLIIGFISIGLLIHIFHHIDNGTRYQGAVKYLPIANYHTIGVGALLAYLIERRPNSLRILTSILNPILCLFFFGIAYYTRLKYPDSRLFILIHESILCWLTMSLVFHGWKGYEGLTKRIFDSKFVQYIGKTSYGIYLFETPVSFLIINSALRLHVDFWGSVTIKILVLALATILISAISYKYLEQPFLKLKRRYY